ALFVGAAAACSAYAVAVDPVGVGLFIAEMARHSDTDAGILHSDREMLAAERFAELLAALAEPADGALLRGLRRGGAIDRPLPLPAQRRIRRACLRLRRAPANTPTLEPLPTALWDELLAGLARSLAFDRESELRSDVAGDGLGETALDRVRAQVRDAIARGAHSPVQWSVSIVPSRPDAETSAGAWPPRERELLPAGHRVGRFTLLQRLGVGAMGVVYSAVDPELDRRIAVKLLRAPSGPRAARAQARLLREAQAMARVAHPNVAVVHDVGTHDGDVFVAMELVRGVTLHSWLQARPRGWREVVEVFMQAARGLAAAHAAGLVHRDFKPSNAMLGDDGRVRVLDFGLCFTGGASEPADAGDLSGSDHDLRITQREEIVGTPAYMPPEQFLRGGQVGPASDQFSFCASLYEGLYAQLPFAGHTVAEVTQAIALGQLRPPPRGTRVPAWLLAVLRRGLQPDPDLRFPAMEAMIRALDRGRARARGGLALASALALATGVGGFWAAHSHGSTHDPCDGGVDRIAEVWGPAQTSAAEQALAAAGPAFTREVWP
ncbi:MAG: serine/threonine protein kinase, partial [Myxococcales bacterium]|nr:serine/threonine protein kinase [Myxococcales bacterium]